MKVNKGIFLVLFLAIGIICGIVYYNTNIKINEQHLSFNFVNQKTNLKEVIDDSELIIKGKVSKITPLKFHEVIFTDYEITVDQVLKGKNQKVVVRLTGGTFERTKAIVDAIKPLAKNEEYILCLQKTFPEDPNSNIFTPVGAFQGIFSIKELDNGHIKINEFNTNNKIENIIKEKEFSSDINEFK